MVREESCYCCEACVVLRARYEDDVLHAQIVQLFRRRQRRGHDLRSADGPMRLQAQRRGAPLRQVSVCAMLSARRLFSPKATCARTLLFGLYP